MAEIASAYVTLIPSAKNMSSKIAQELGDAGADGGKSASKGFLGNFVSVGTKVAGIGAAAVAGVGALLGGLAIKGGISRALQIEDAQAKLKGLGHTTDGVKTIMDNALAAVKGTAFGLGDAATVAASAVAAGVKPGADLERNLRLVGDAATIAGTDMGSMGAIFNKVAATGKLQGDSIQQLGQAGIPILGLLSKTLGKTQEEVAQMASKGQIDFAMFQDAMESGLGGAALKSGETFRGALANTKAALSRIGETFITPFLGAIKQGLNAAIPALDGINAALKPVMAGFGEWLTNVTPKVLAGISGMIGGFKDMVAAFKGQSFDVSGSGFGQFMVTLGLLGREAVTKVKGLADAFKPVGEAIGTVFKQFGPVIAALVPKVIALWQSFSPLSLVFRALQPVLPQLLGLLGQLAATLGGALLVVIHQVLPPIQSLANVLSQTLGQVFATVMPVVVTLVGQFAAMLARLVPVVVPIIATLAQLIAQLVAQLAPVFVELVGSILPPVVEIFGVVTGAIAPLVSMVAGLLIPIIQALLPVVTTVFTAVGNVIKSAMQIVQGIIQVVTGIISGDWSKVWTGIQNIFGGIWNTIKAILQGALNIVMSAIQGALGVIAGIWNAAWSGIGSFLSQVWEGAKRAVSNGIEGVLSFVRDLPGRILGFFAGAGTWLIDAGHNIINGFLGGLKDAFGGVMDFIGGIGSWIAEHKGPKAYDLRLLVPAGGWIMDGLSDGLEKGIPGLRKTLGGVSAEIKAGVNVPTGAQWSGSFDTAGTAAGTVLNVENMYGNPHDIVEEIETQKRRAIAVNGLRAISVGV